MLAFFAAAFFVALVMGILDAPAWAIVSVLFLAWWIEVRTTRDPSDTPKGAPPQKAIIGDVPPPPQDGVDPMLKAAAEVCIKHKGGSPSLLQQKFKLDYEHAARMIDQLHEAGVLGPWESHGPRKALVELSALEGITWPKHDAGTAPPD